MEKEWVIYRHRQTYTEEIEGIEERLKKKQKERDKE